jgi:hypothetical protein
MVSCCGAHSSVVSHESHLSLSSQKHSQLGTYISVMSLTYQSSRMKASMSENLIKMGQEAARATKLQAAATPSSHFPRKRMKRQMSTM